MTGSMATAIIPRLMQSGLPNTIQPWKLAEQGARLAGTFSLACMPRLTSMLANTDAQVAVELTADTDEEGIPYLEVHLETTATAICQRCMEALALPLTAHSRLALLRGEAGADTLPAAYDPLVVSGSNASLVEIVEDELILALPFSPRCADPTVCQRTPAMPGPSKETPNHPFEALSVLLSESKKE